MVDIKKNHTGCAANEEPSLRALGQAEHVQRAHERSFDGFHCIELIVRRRRGTSKMVYF